MTQAPHDASRGSNRSSAVEFLAALFNGTSDDSDGQVYLSSLPNERDDPLEPIGERNVCPASGEQANKFVGRWDRPKRGLFVCVGTVADNKRNKDNVRETVCLHADVDFKALTCDEPTIRAALDNLPTAPSIVVRSGNGLHLYWLLREPIDTQQLLNRIEAALRKLADVVGGDPAVCHAAALMRLPGTHNTKKGDWRDVVIERLDADVRYELEDLEDWLDEQRPVLARKSVIPTPKEGGSHPSSADDNPFLAAAKLYSYKPRLDIEAALAAMGEGNIHVTLRNVSASMIQAGDPLEEVVCYLMESVRKVAGPDWNWRAEEKKIRDLCLSAQRKFAPTVSREAEGEPPSEDDNVVNFGDAKTHRKPRQTIKASKVNHITIGKIFLGGLEIAGEAVLFTEKGHYTYEGTLWHRRGKDDFAAWINTRLEQCVRGTPAKSTIRLIGEARAWVVRHPDLQGSADVFDRHGKVPTRSGLVDPRTGDLTPARQGDYCTWQVPHGYDPAATCPHWLQILRDTFADRSPDVIVEYVSLLQEWSGVGLVDSKAKALSRALSPTGGSNTGKSTLLNVLGGLYSTSQITTPIEKLDGNHGLMPFADRRPWVLHEAFEPSKWHMSSTVKAIIEGRPVQINEKNGRIYSHTYTGPVIWGANNDPQFKEATKAIVNRLLAIPCRREFKPEDPPVGVAIMAQAAGLEEPSDLVLRDEMPGVLAWAVEGLKRALARGRFLIPAESRAVLDAIQRDNNIALGFVEDCVDFDPDRMVSTPDFAAAFASWWLEHKGDNSRVPSSDSIGKALKSLGDFRIAIDLSLRSNHRRYYGGVVLNVEGMRHWGNAVASSAYVFQGHKASTTDAGGNPNTQIPGNWSGKQVILAMRVAQGKTVTLEETW